MDAAGDKQSLDVVRLLLDRGANPNARDDRAYTPLHYAARAGAADAAAELLNRGAEASPLSDVGQTPIMIAQKYHHPEIVDLLHERGAVK